MNREEALAHVYDKWNLRYPKEFRHGDCAHFVFDYYEARTGKKLDYDIEDELNVHNVRKHFGEPHKEGEIGMMPKGLFVVLPKGGMAGCWEETKGFGRVALSAEDVKCVRFFKGN